jgi:dTDP-4-amino-4,6-dideoxygalactose transaminase
MAASHVSPTTAVIPVMRPALTDEEARAVADAVSSGWVAQGPRVEAFEKAFATAVRASNGVAVSSCTAGLHLAMTLLEVGPHDDVVVPSLSFIATANAVRYVGARPVFADVELATGNLTANTVAAALTPATRAVILVHQAGVPADVEAIRAVCEPQGVEVVEDAACAAGSTYRGRPVGTESRLAAWSFHPRKVITTGEGGMVTTEREDWAQRLRRLREHGMSMSASQRHASMQPVLEQYLELGFNYRMTDIQAALGIVQLRRLTEIVERRRFLARRYQSALAGLPGITTVQDPPYGTTNFQSFWILLQEDFPLTRNEVLQQLADKGISARRGIMAAHLEPAYETQLVAELPITERLTRESLILPLYHSLTEDDQDRVIDALYESGR